MNAGYNRSEALLVSLGTGKPPLPLVYVISRDEVVSQYEELTTF